MKKILLGSIVAGLLIFIWQTLSWMVMDLHAKSHKYTDKEAAIMNVLNSELTEEGQYYLPGYKPEATAAEHEAVAKGNLGKPWAMVSYHKSFEMPIAGNIIRGLVVNILLMLLFCWILSKIAAPKFSTVFMASIFTGLIAFLNTVYTGHIWYYNFDLMAHFVDAIVGWGIAGLWLGWWYSKK
jgi:hypothetical protein